MVARVLAENTSPIIVVALVGLSEERVEWFELLYTAVHPSDDRCDDEFEAF